MAVTIKQIATAAGVSRGTVDRVLHNRPGVKPEIAEHVRKIANSLGYFPNRAGKMLAARKQPIKIGCFLPGVGNLFFDDVIKGYRKAEAELADFGISLVIKSISGFDEQEHINSINYLVEQGCSALCLSTIDIPKIHDLVNQLVDSGIPVVAVNTDLSHTKRLCYVGCNYLEAGSTAAGLLSLMSPKETLNLLIVTGSLHMKGHNDRIRGFASTLRKKSVPYRLIDVFESQDNDEHAYEMAMKVLTKHPEINCVFIAAAGVIGVCRAIEQLSLEHKLIVVSYDEIEPTRQLIRKGVIDFTIGQEPVEQGYRAIQILFNYFISDKRLSPEDHITKTVIKIKENL